MPTTPAPERSGSSALSPGHRCQNVEPRSEGRAPPLPMPEAEPPHTRGEVAGLQPAGRRASTMAMDKAAKNVRLVPWACVAARLSHLVQRGKQRRCRRRR